MQKSTEPFEVSGQAEATQRLDLGPSSEDLGKASGPGDLGSTPRDLEPPSFSGRRAARGGAQHVVLSSADPFHYSDLLCLFK